ncbi:MAG: Rrf2 family transcriptional regulator [Candidatus Marinimicrobia bacterium]|nr:Rrf2 family transcriptional regulator [Candidatus Neomarinimicrobiota bacterium]
MPETLLRKIIVKFVKLGLIHSYLGTGGGISLAKPAESVSLLDVIEAIEGKIFLNNA